MPWNATVATLVDEFGLKPEYVYLLPLVPLIEIMWADGKVQPAEISILYECVTRHLADLHTAAGGEEVVGVEEAEAFLDHFLKAEPDPEVLRRLRELTVELLNATAPESQRRTLLDNCLDIAAVAVSAYPYGRRDRVMAAEKALLHELFNSLRLS
jgi:hypothetical protein